MPSQPKPERTISSESSTSAGWTNFKPTPRAASSQSRQSRLSVPSLKRRASLVASPPLARRRSDTGQGRTAPLPHGRNKQLSLKVTEETAQRFTRLADEQRLVLGELLKGHSTHMRRATRRGDISQNCWTSIGS